MNIIIRYFFQNIKNIFLSKNKISDKGCKYISNGLDNFPNLNSLGISLEDCEIEDVGVKFMAEGIRKLP